MKYTSKKYIVLMVPRRGKRKKGGGQVQEAEEGDNIDTDMVLKSAKKGKKRAGQGKSNSNGIGYGIPHSNGGAEI